MSPQPESVRLLLTGIFLAVGIFLLGGVDVRSELPGEAGQGRSMGLFHIYHYDVPTDEVSGKKKEVFIPLAYEVRRIDYGDGTFTDDFILQEDEWKKVGNPKLSYSRTTYKGLIPLAFTLEVEWYLEGRNVIQRAFFENRKDYSDGALQGAFDALLSGEDAILPFDGTRKVLVFSCPEPGRCLRKTGEDVADYEAPHSGEIGMRLAGALHADGRRLLVIEMAAGLYCYDADRELVIGQSSPDEAFLRADMLTIFEAKLEESETVRTACLRSDGKPIP